MILNFNLGSMQKGNRQEILKIQCLPSTQGFVKKKKRKEKKKAKTKKKNKKKEKKKKNSVSHSSLRMPESECGHFTVR